MKLIATKSYDCGGRSLRAGDEFEVSKELAKALMSLGRATVSTVDAEGVPLVVQSNDYEVAQFPNKRRRGRPPGKRNTYTRRDLRAEE